MKNRILLILLLGLMCLSFTPNKTITIKGRIKAKGNEPFVYPVLLTEDEKELQLESEIIDVNKLLFEQGKKLIFTGQVRKVKNTNILFFNVESYEIEK